MRRWIAVGLLLVLAVNLVGCGSTNTRLLEQLGVISAIAYDSTEGGKLLGTVVLPNFTDTGAEKIDVLSSSAYTSKLLRFNMSRMSERKLVAGQIRVVLYGEELAKQGLLPLTDTLFRDAEIGSQMHLAVTQGLAHDFFRRRYPDKPSIDIYLYRLLRKEMEQRTIPKSNLHRFIHDVYDNGKDPVLPYLRLGKEDVILDGLAVFRGDKFVGRLNATEARSLAYLFGGNSTGEIDAELSEEKIGDGDSAHAVIMYLKMKRKLDAEMRDGIPQFRISIRIEGAVTEYTGNANLEEKNQVKKIEEEASRQLQSQIIRMLQKLQREFKADPLGLGELWRSKGFVKTLDRKLWDEQYQQAKIDVDVQVRILQTGMIH